MFVQAAKAAMPGLSFMQSEVSRQQVANGNEAFRESAALVIHFWLSLVGWWEEQFQCTSTRLSLHTGCGCQLKKLAFYGTNLLIRHIILISVFMLLMSNCLNYIILAIWNVVLCILKQPNHNSMSKCNTL